MQRPTLKHTIDADRLTALSLAVREASDVRRVCAEMGIEGAHVETGIVAVVNKGGRFFSVPSDAFEQSDLFKRLVALPDWMCVGLLVSVLTSTEYVRWSKALVAGPEAQKILNLALYGQANEGSQ